MTAPNTPQPTDEIVATDDYIERRMEFISAFPDCGEWHYIRRIRADAATIERLTRENSTLRTVVAKAKIPCVYCGLEDMSKCVLGFPGCAKADDILCGEEEGWREAIGRMRKVEDQLATRDAALKVANETIDKLPKTADGVPIVPGMDLWQSPFDETEDDGSVYHHEAVSRGKVSKEYICFGNGPGSVMGPIDVYSPPMPLYSSMDATITATLADGGKENPHA